MMSCSDFTTTRIHFIGELNMKKPGAYLHVEKATSSVLIVEDDFSLACLLKSYLHQETYQASICHTPREALKNLQTRPPDLILLDLSLPPMHNVNEGLQFMTACLPTSPHSKIIIMTGEGTRDTAVNCIRLGAEDYLVKPIDLSALSVIIERALKHRNLELRLASMQKERREKACLGKLLGESFLMQRVFDKIHQAARTDDNILLQGESGTGKGLAAETIHIMSRRKNKPFVKVNCTALYEALLESELFGHEKGSFTGAVRKKIGKFEFADGGTLFLDEIGEMPPWTQVKLLHAVEDKVVQRIGGNQSVRVDLRIIAATNTNIKEQVRDKRFRLDLYYRLNTRNIMLPPLRKRESDINLLAEYFLQEFKRSHFKGLSLASQEKLMQYDWPGNIRELRSVISRAVGNAPDGGWIDPHHLEIDTDTEEMVEETHQKSLQERLHHYERLVILNTLSKNKGNVSRTARELVLTRSGLHKKIARLKITI